MNIRVDQLPSRIVISRKGSDSSWGGSPSLIVSGELISLPIPEHKSRLESANCSDHLKYSDLPPHPLLGSYLTYLQKLGPWECVHLDPDIRPELRLPVNQGRQLLFGQSGSSEAHLRNQKVDRGDLFLFFGWFKEFEKRNSSFVPKGRDQHVIWGWFQIEERHQVESDDEARKLEWADHHPHVKNWRSLFGKPGTKRNSLYSAVKSLAFAPEIFGAGVFRWSDSLCLSRICNDFATRSEWCVPRFFAEAGLTYNLRRQDIIGLSQCPDDNSRIHFRSAQIGQEFVLPCDKGQTIQDLPIQAQEQIAAWLSELFATR